MSRVRCLRCVWASLRRMARVRPALADLPYAIHGAFLNEHPVVHSRVVDYCIDKGIVAVVEYINKEICPTRFSCQGDARPQDYPMVSVPTKSWPVLRAWLTARGFTVTDHALKDRAVTPPVRNASGPIDYGNDLAAWSYRETTHLYFTFREPAEVFPVG